MLSKRGGGSVMDGKRASRCLFAAAVWLLALAALNGCGGGTAGTAGEPPAKQRLTQLLRLYKAHLDKQKRAPASEQALRDFAAKLTPAEREACLLGEDFDTIFTSPRDNQKFVVKYNLRLSPGENRGIAWEATGQGGRRFVALSAGYVEDLAEENAKEHMK